MKSNNSEKGQALILIAFGIVALIGFTALAVDGGRVFSDRRNAQNAADTSALAAALAELHEDQEGFEARGLQRAASNGYENDADSQVTVVFCNTVQSSSNPCTGLPPGADPSEYIRVEIISDVPMTFARVLGREFVTNRVEAITRVQGNPTTGPFFAGAGLYSVRNDNADDCFQVNGSADLTLHDTGIFVNCSGSSALFLNGSADIGMDANAEVAGCVNNPSFPITGTGQIDCGVAQQIVNENTFAGIPTVLPTPTCNGNAVSGAGGTLSPGYVSNDITAETTFQPGTYCFINGAKIRPIGGKSIQGTGGTVQIVMSTGSFIDLKGSANYFDDLEIYANNSDFNLNGNLTANRFRFFGRGNSTFNVQGGSFTSSDAYIYSQYGEVDINAQAVVNMHAPPQGDTFGGILIYMPWENPNDFILNGGSNSTWYGTVLVPHANVTYNGHAGFELHGQVIGYTFKINGYGETDIFFDSSVTYAPPNDPTIEFTK
jgi:hypothetical protein